MTPKQVSALPLYVQLRDFLMAKIASGDWKPGLAIPNELELSRQYGLSVGTVRRALDWMEEAKLLTRKQGRGTFVRDPTSEEFVNWYERLRKSDGSPLQDVVGASCVVEAEANADECARLHLQPGDHVRRTRRTRLLGDVPYMLETSVVPVALFPLQGDAAGTDHRLLDLAKMCGVLLGKGEERISPELAVGETAAALGCGPNEPLLRLDRTIFTIDGKPAKWRVGHCRLIGHYYSASIGPDT